MSPFSGAGECLHVTSLTFKTPWGGGTPLYKLYKYVPPHQVGFLHGFGLKKGIHFADFGLESGMVFEGTTAVYERIYHKLLQFQMTKKEREI